MNLIDMRTVAISYVISNAICAAVVAILWLQNRRKFAGLDFWLVGFVMQFVMWILVVLRGAVPDFVSMVVSNVFLIVGTFLLYIGLERFAGKRGPQIHNAVLLIVFTLVQTYFTAIQPNLAAREINISVGSLLLCAQIAWFMLFRVDVEMRPITRGVGIVSIALGTVSAIRIIVVLAVPPGDDFFHSTGFDTLLMLTYQMLFIILTFSLALMVNHRLFADLESDITERKQAEEALHQSEQKLRSIIEQSPDGITVTDEQGLITEWNQAMEQITGLKASDVLHTPIWDAQFQIGLEDRKTPELYQRIKTMIADLLKSGQAPWVGQTIETEHKYPDGIQRFIQSVTFPIQTHQGFMLGSVLRDVTEHRQADDLIKLRLRLWEYAAAHPVDELMTQALDEIGELTGSPIGFYHFVEEDQQTLSLQAWSTRTLQEFCRAEGKGLHYSIDKAGVWVDCVREGKPVIHNDYAALPHRKGMPDGHAEVTRELVVPTMRDNRILSILGVGNKLTDYDEKDIELVAYVADIVWSIIERKRAEETLRRKNEYLNALQKTTLDVISWLDLSSLLEKIVKRAGLLMGTSSGYLGLVEPVTNELRFHVGLGVFADTPTFRVKPGEGLAGTVWQTGKPLVVDDYDTWASRLGSLDRGTIHAAVGVPLVSGTQVLGVLALAHDAETSRTFGQEAVEFLSQFARLAAIAIENARLLEELRKSNVELQARNEELDAFGHTVAHDLKNPLSNIIGFAYLLKDRETAPSEEETYKMAQTIEQMGLKMDSIIEELMLLSGLRRSGVQTVPLDMDDIMTAVLWRLASMIEEAQAEIVHPASWPKAMGHAPWVEEVWINYVSNAIKYGGHPPRIELGAAQEDDSVRFWVQDNGPGLFPGEQSRLFAPFEQLEQTRLSGHGLGLSIVRRIVERMGGQVSVKSSGVAGEGSVFSFTLPAA